MVWFSVYLSHPGKTVSDALVKVSDAVVRREGCSQVDLYLAHPPDYTPDGVRHSSEESP